MRWMGVVMRDGWEWLGGSGYGRDRWSGWGEMGGSG